MYMGKGRIGGDANLSPQKWLKIKLRTPLDQKRNGEGGGAGEGRIEQMIERTEIHPNVNQMLSGLLPSIVSLHFSAYVINSFLYTSASFA